ncbi:DNA replication helicase [Mycena indigotica]|uniref:DNA replication ATP-dependent helicase/nuclease DNA2 n=1 Tax=Mycena indigotica TaxID=2126181 RepID=A0A8H6SFZ8_9AGAR|nr:DNA replication helicase [Mycena indigotica]KAF7298895.1 DNA replication helicase [Mycena indigotica]
MPTPQEEEEFMKSLLLDLERDSSFWTATLTPDPSPVKPTSATTFTLSAASSPCSTRLPPTTPTKPAKPLAQTVAVEDVDMSALLDGAEDWDWSEPLLSPVKPKPKAKRKPIDTPIYLPPPFIRCVVESVAVPEVSRGKMQKDLSVRLDGPDVKYCVTLQDEWARTDVRVGDIINIVGSSPLSTAISITSSQNFLILHPDLLLTPTTLANSIECRRKQMISSLVRSTSDTSPALVWGNILHEVMQSCMAVEYWDERWIEAKVEEIIREHISDIAKINLSVEDARREINLRARGLKAFSEKYLADSPKPEAILTNTRSGPAEVSALAVSQLLDIEEDIWSPMWGLKGKIDATVLAIISDSAAAKTVLSSGPKPFEIKTGRPVASLEHRAQTMLYTLLTQERYGAEVTSGLLFYTQSEEVVRVPATRNDIKGLIGIRNEIAGYMMRRTKANGSRFTSEPEPFLPPTIDDERICKRCYNIDACMLYRKAVENVEDTRSPISDIYQLKTSHITSEQAEFFKQWEALLSLEEQDLLRFRKELWTMGAAQREAKGRCFSSMALDTTFSPPKYMAKTHKIHQFTYRFVRNSEATSLLNKHIGVGEPITVSVEPNMYALSRGFILELEPLSVVIGVDRELSLDNINMRLARFRPSGASIGSPVFRIDKDEMFGGMGRMRDNLAHLFYVDGDQRRLELIVNLRPPVFVDPSTAIPAHLTTHIDSLNSNQQDAIHKVLRAEDYSLILGMPGTGKTTVIASLIKIMVGMGKTVLLTSYTHSAVDNILLKLKGKVDFDILRLGNVDKVHPDAREFTLEARRTPTTVEQLEHQILSPPVVATTCLSVDHALFSRRKFDYCIVDEASQITLPTCLGPLRFAQTFVLVGDHHQLPPLVRNKDARKGGLDVSLFRRLSTAHPDAVADMSHQYRMNEDIMTLSNRLIYNNKLRCGSDEVARQSLVLPDRTFMDGLHKGTMCHSKGCWLDCLMAESCKAVFVDTDALPARDSKVGDLVQNEVEAALVSQITETLLRSGVSVEQIGILSLYRQQLKLLNHLLQHRKGLELLTADRSQGRDKDCIIISLVRSNLDGNVGDLIKDWRRMNVSFTRARSKLIIVGSRKTLQAAPLLKDFFELMDSRGWILALPPQADTLHPCFAGVPSGGEKRRAEEPAKENAVERPVKKIKTKEEGILRGRPILRDLVNESIM